MWNVSESTVKRWADTAGLGCQRTPGGHRRFALQDIRGFQQDRGFEATGLLTTQRWEDPSVEDLLNRKDFARVREQVSFLAAHNQRSQIEELLKRLYLRGMSLEHLYDYVVMPVARSTHSALSDQVLSGGQAKLILVNLEEAVSYLFPHIIRKRRNGRVSLCSSPDRAHYLPVNAAARILEVEGWEVLNLGWSVPLPTMATMVQEEPINMVCVVSDGSAPLAPTPELEILLEAVREYRLPLVCLGQALLVDGDLKGSVDGYCFSDFSSFRDFIASSHRTA